MSALLGCVALPKDVAVSFDPKTREGHERPLIGMLLHGLLNILFHELLDSLRCLKATGVGLIMGHR